MARKPLEQKRFTDTPDGWADRVQNPNPKLRVELHEVPQVYRQAVAFITRNSSYRERHPFLYPGAASDYREDEGSRRQGPVKKVIG